MSHLFGVASVAGVFIGMAMAITVHNWNQAATQRPPLTLEDCNNFGGLAVINAAGHVEYCIVSPKGAVQ